MQSIAPACNSPVLSAEQDGTIANRYVEQHHRLGPPKSCWIGRELEVQIGGGFLYANSQLVGEPIQVTGPTDHWEEPNLSLVQGSIDVDELRIHVDEDVGFVEFRMRSEEFGY